ncbi:ABC transporter ATP-binding protein [Lactobacillus sp. ESL0233]|uniref:ABC transporter ATP-binding protein n=1 Tax=Lactobacillus sp. ESL0233 TaxID=2069354 RepID=UPI000EFC4E4D|nr:ABC transporter ATP-binding protein [Lactobacillus sp. ESL0233]RMC41481.1 ABC transporter ATP-binding protein [Lactobacillus sp. ESL0233]
MNKKIKLYAISWQFILGLILGIFGTFIEVLIPLIVRQFIDGKTHISAHINFRLVAVIVLTIIFSSIISAFCQYLISVAGNLKIAEVRMEIEQKLLTLPMSFFTNQKSGQLSSHLINDAEIVQDFMTSSIPATINSLITVLGSFIVLFHLDWQLTVFIVLSFSLIILIAYPIGKISEKLSLTTQNKLSELSGQSTENIYNIRSIKLNNAYRPVLLNFKQVVVELFKVSNKTDRIFSIVGPIQTVFTLGIILLIIIYGGIRVQQASLSIGTLVSFLIYLFQVIEPINMLGNFYTSYKQAKGATLELNKILNTPGEKSVYQVNSQILFAKNSCLTLKNASFSYQKEPVLQNISLSFNSGQKIAIVGPSGAGKTTIINLLTRLYELNEGQLLLNSVSATNYDLNTWRNLFAVVTQENTIISGSIYLNLTFGLTVIPEESDIWAALDKANLLEDVQKMPNGLQTLVGEQGVGLSGGQRQRLQIARAYLRQANFLILDEATSNLDPNSEKIITNTLNELLANHQTTLIVIAHRLSTIVDSDKIYFLDNHQITGSGTHQELMQLVPKYKQFVNEELLAVEK